MTASGSALKHSPAIMQGNYIPSTLYYKETKPEKGKIISETNYTYKYHLWSN